METFTVLLCLFALIMAVLAVVSVEGANNQKEEDKKKSQEGAGGCFFIIIILALILTCTLSDDLDFVDEYFFVVLAFIVILISTPFVWFSYKSYLKAEDRNDAAKKTQSQITISTNSPPPPSLTNLFSPAPEQSSKPTPITETPNEDSVHKNKPLSWHQIVILATAIIGLITAIISLIAAILGNW